MIAACFFFPAQTCWRTHPGFALSASSLTSRNIAASGGVRAALISARKLFAPTNLETSATDNGWKTICDNAYLTGPRRSPNLWLQLEVDFPSKDYPDQEPSMEKCDADSARSGSCQLGRASMCRSSRRCGGFGPVTVANHIRDDNIGRGWRAGSWPRRPAALRAGRAFDGRLHRLRDHAAGGRARRQARADQYPGAAR